MTIQELDKCIDQYGKEIYSFCMYLTRNRDSADELYQDTFLQAMLKINEINTEENPKSYFLSIAIGIWKNRLRKFAWRNRIAPMYPEDETRNLSTEAFDDVQMKIEEEEERQTVMMAVNGLSDKLRIPILLYYKEELSISEIARLLSLPEGTIKSRLHNAKIKLEKELEVYYS